MKNTTKICIAVFILLNGSLNAQDISAALGSIETNFQFYSDTIDLEVTSQFIIKNAGTFHYSRASESYAYGYGGGYESYHLEFVTRKSLSTFKIKGARHKFELAFVDSSNIILTNVTFNSDQVSYFGNPEYKGTPKFYSFDLVDIPVSVLDRTKTIYVSRISP